ncbi:hypothetical protein BZA05DRAFT_421331 [Tricharina praecox]|uniref:uncharacterized protein n=1 Tax=Tricharina praecox TaxID=43433 RepID=UPI0022205D95|nr:uncharacterized protein BZA05DRAFT_421331 [Tricharina praecox]KAI5845501.1 hypothetical protein BZA05DRAFT_421331 [Tricharina praecox]
MRSSRNVYGRETIPLSQVDPHAPLHHLREFMTAEELERAKPKGIYAECFKRPESWGPNPFPDDDLSTADTDSQDDWNPFEGVENSGGKGKCKGNGKGKGKPEPEPTAVVNDEENVLGEMEDDGEEEEPVEPHGDRVVYDVAGRRLLRNFENEDEYAAMLKATGPDDPEEAAVRPSNISAGEWKNLLPKERTRLIERSYFYAFVCSYRMFAAYTIAFGITAYLVITMVQIVEPGWFNPVDTSLDQIWKGIEDRILGYNWVR